MLEDTPTAWTRLSPWLDDLLNLTPAERTARLAALQREDGPLASHLQQLLAQLDGLDADGFMAAPAQAAPGMNTAAVDEVIGAYTLERLLGEGGMGAVWLARRSDGRFQGQVAIKLLHGGHRIPALVRRFAREAQALGRLAHPHIARLLDAGLTPGDAQPYLVLEYVQGQPIDQWCDSQQLGLRQRLRLLLDVMDAVAHAQERLVLHRDLKPANILVDEQGQVKLLDFGIARLLGDDTGPAEADLTRLGGAAYTPRWAAPEQLEGAELTAACDVYALGLLTHLLLTGLHPLGEVTTASTTRQLKQRAALPLASARMQSQAAGETGDGAQARLAPAVGRAGARALRGDLDTIIAKALKLAPAERYRGAAEMADDLRRHLRHQPILARPDSTAYRATRFLRRHWLAVGSASAVAMALLAGGGVALLQARQAQAERAQAEGLLQYMLVELRGKLEPLGQLPLLDDLGKKALAYYDARALDTLDNEGLVRRTQALHLLGGIAEQQGRLADATRIAQQAHDGSRLLLQRQPKNARALGLHAQSERRLALAAEGSNRQQQAEAHYLACLQLDQQALALQPADPKLRLEVADAQGELAALYALTKRPELALPLFDLERDELATQAPTQPSLWHVLANNRAWVAETLYRLDRFDAALRAAQAHGDAIAQVPDLATHIEARWYATLGQNRRSGILQALGRLDEAAAASRQAVRDMDELAARDRSNTGWQMQAAYHRQQLASVLQEAGRLPEAQREITASRAVLDAMRPGADIQLERLSAVWLRVLATQAELTPQRPGVVEQLQQRIAAELQRETRVTRRGRELGQDLARARLLLGQQRAGQGQTAEARALWQTALNELDEQFTGDTHLSAGARDARARLLLALGRLDEARREAQALRGLGWRRPLPAALG